MKFAKMSISRTALACALVLSACVGDDSVIRDSSTQIYEQIDHEPGHAQLLMRGPHRTALKLPQRPGGEKLIDGTGSRLKSGPVDVEADQAYWKAIYGATFYGLRALWITELLSDMLQDACDESSPRASAGSPTLSDGASEWEACPHGGSMRLTRMEAAGPERTVTIRATYAQCRISNSPFGTEVELNGEASIAVEEAASIAVREAALPSAVVTMGGNGGALQVRDLHTSMAIHGSASTTRIISKLSGAPSIRLFNTQPGFIVSQTSSEGNESTIGLQNVNMTRRAFDSDGMERLWLGGALKLQHNVSAAPDGMPEELDICVKTDPPMLISAHGINSGSLIAITKPDNRAKVAEFTGLNDIVIHTDTPIHISLREPSDVLRD